ncbi:MAG: hypothetical protein AABZ09_09670 [Candidatus Binatota bacterium]
MILSRPIQLLIGATSCLPFIYLVYFFLTVFSSMGYQGRSPENFDFLFRLHLGTMLLIFVLLVFYLVYLFRTDRVPSDKKALWAVVLFMGNMIAIPIFWYLYIWGKGKAKLE